MEPTAAVFPHCILLEIAAHMAQNCYVHLLFKDLSTGSILQDFKMQHHLGEEEPVNLLIMGVKSEEYFDTLRLRCQHKTSGMHTVTRIQQNLCLFFFLIYTSLLSNTLSTPLFYILYQFSSHISIGLSWIEEYFTLSQDIEKLCLISQVPCLCASTVFRIPYILVAHLSIYIPYETKRTIRAKYACSVDPYSPGTWHKPETRWVLDKYSLNE